MPLLFRKEATAKRESIIMNFTTKGAVVHRGSGLKQEQEQERRLQDRK